MSRDASGPMPRMRESRTQWVGIVRVGSELYD